jgi:hypothetical protein
MRRGLRCGRSEWYAIEVAKRMSRLKKIGATRCTGGASNERFCCVEPVSTIAVWWPARQHCDKGVEGAEGLGL